MLFQCCLVLNFPLLAKRREYSTEGWRIIAEISIQSYQTSKGHYSSCQIPELKYTFAKYDGRLPTSLTSITTHSHTHTPSGHVWVSISAKRRPPRGTDETACYGKQTHPFPPSNQRSVCLGRRLSPAPPPWGLLTPALFPDLGPRRDERVHNTTSFICLISPRRVMIKADPPPRAPCYHIKYRIKQQGSPVSYKHTRIRAGLKRHDWKEPVAFISSNVLPSFVSVLWHIRSRYRHTVQPISTLLKESIYVLFTSRPLLTGEEQEFPKCRKNSCSVRPESWPEDIPAILEGCIKIPYTPLHGHYLISYALACQSNGRLVPVPESNPSAKIFRRRFILEDSRLAEAETGESEWMNGECRNGRWMSMSQAGSDGKNDTLCHCWDGSGWAIHQQQWQVEQCKALWLRFGCFHTEPPSSG